MNNKTIPRMAACRSVTRGYMQAYTFGSMAAVVIIILAMLGGCSRLGWL